MKWEYAVIGIIFLIWTGLSVYSGYHLRKVPKCPEITIIPKDSTDSTSVHLEVTKPAEITKLKKPFNLAKDSIVNVDSCSQKQTYSEIIDTTIVFNSDSLDFVADINFDGEKFNNYFDFNLRVKKVFETIIHEVPIPYKAEIYQHPLVIVLGLITAFLFGLAL